MLFVLQIPSNRHFKISLKISSVLAKCIALPKFQVPLPQIERKEPSVTYVTVLSLLEMHSGGNVRRP